MKKLSETYAVQSVHTFEDKKVNTSIPFADAGLAKDFIRETENCIRPAKILNVVIFTVWERSNGVLTYSTDVFGADEFLLTDFPY